ncbi:MAG: hypothetical protein ACRD0Y_03345 [Terriglobales bacterium]
MYRTAIFALAVTVGLSLAAGAQGLQHSEISLQVSGLFNSNNNGTPTHHLATNSAGLLLGYRLHLTRWEALEVEYGYTRNGQRYATPATAPGTPGTNYAITSNFQELIANEVVTTPKVFGIFQPFILGGGGAVLFSPRGASTIALLRQTRGAVNAGAGVDFHVAHLGFRAEFQELWFKIPDFRNPLLTVNKWTHVAQPSVGLIFTF